MSRLFAVALLVSQVACASSWPTVQASGDGLTRTTIASIDVMPSDLQVWARQGEETPENEIGAALDQGIANTVPALLAERGYQVGALLGWDGRYEAVNGQQAEALSPKQMAETAWALSSYGVALDRAGRTGLVPHLPHRLGERTGSDATLYIGGWAYAGKERKSNASKAIKIVAIVLVVAVVVVAIAALADDASFVGDVAKGVGRAGKQVAKASARVAGGIGRAAIRVGSHSTRVMADVAQSMDVGHIEIHFDDRDCFGRVDTHTSWYRGRPDFYAQKATPSKGPSEAQIEMTLVDNRSGHVLWHARQRFPADPKKPKDVRKMMKRMLDAMPHRFSAQGAIAAR